MILVDNSRVTRRDEHSREDNYHDILFLFQWKLVSIITCPDTDGDCGHFASSLLSRLPENNVSIVGWDSYDTEPTESEINSMLDKVFITTRSK